jgi:hypothetical protein
MHHGHDSLDCKTFNIIVYMREIKAYALLQPDTLTPRKLQTRPYESTMCRPLGFISPPVPVRDQSCAYARVDPGMYEGSKEGWI